MASVTLEAPAVLAEPRQFVSPAALDFSLQNCLRSWLVSEGRIALLQLTATTSKNATISTTIPATAVSTAVPATVPTSAENTPRNASEELATSKQTSSADAENTGDTGDAGNTADTGGTGDAADTGPAIFIGVSVEISEAADNEGHVELAEAEMLLRRALATAETLGALQNYCAALCMGGNTLQEGLATL
ncbi:hypothetical protein T492DRAFT_860069 [Pavlovales sp. CCMP2436]|nr:hypothetical protein T492DRAFT_860069 [Pavlovales sp. CCMP2436]